MVGIGLRGPGPPEESVEVCFEAHRPKNSQVTLPCVYADDFPLSLSQTIQSPLSQGLQGPLPSGPVLSSNIDDYVCTSQRGTSQKSH